MVTKREEADLRRQKREEERRKRFEEDQKAREEKEYRAYLARFNGMDEAAIRTCLTLESRLRSRDALYRPKTEFERIRKVFEELNVPYTEKNLRIASPWHAKIYCKNKLFKKLLAGNWTEFRERLAKERYRNECALEDIAPLTREDRIQFAEKRLREGYYDHALTLFTELGDEEGVKRAAEAMHAAERRAVLEEIRQERFSRLHEKIEQLPMEMRGELRLAFAKAALIYLADNTDTYMISWGALIEYIHEHALEPLYQDAEAFIRRRIKSSPDCVARFALEDGYFHPTPDDLRDLYNHLKQTVLRHGELDLALQALRTIHPEDSDAFRSEQDELLTSRRLYLLKSGSYEAVESQEFAHLPPLRARELHDHLMQRDCNHRLQDMSDAFIAFFSKLIARDLAKA